MRAVTIALALLAAGCSALSANFGTDANVSDAAGSGCNVIVTFDPTQPVAGPSSQVRATATVTGLDGVPAFQWMVTEAGTTIAFTESPDDSQITFPVVTAGTYDVVVNVTGPGFCPSQELPLNVMAQGANVVDYRLRVATAAAPPQEQLLEVSGGAGSYAFGPFVLSPGISGAGTVRNGAAGVAAYLRFIPVGHPDEIVETFSDMTGAFAVQLVAEMHDVLVVPAVAGSAPKLITGWQPGQTLLSVDAGTAISGVVKDPSGAALANTKVQLTIGTVPSTLTTTAADGSFTVRGEPSAGATITVDVTPPATTGLPPLSASSTAFDLTASVQVRYAPTLVVRNLAGTSIQRSGGVPNATVTVVGTLAGIGTVTAGASGAIGATGAVRAVAVTNASGVLPTLLAPNGPLSAVIQLTTSDLAVTAIDLTTAVPATIAAPVTQLANAVTSIATGTLGGASIEAAPIGALELAGATSVEATSAADGSVALQLASGGHYELRLHHNAALAGPLVLPDVTATTLPASLVMPPPSTISGSVAISGNPSPVVAASVQVLCTSCVGIDRTRPIASAASDQAGQFQVTVADPGTE